MDEDNNVMVYERTGAEHDAEMNSERAVAPANNAVPSLWQDAAEWERQKDQAMTLIRRAITTIQQLREENQTLRESAQQIRGENDSLHDYVSSVHRERAEIGAAINELGRVIEMVGADGRNGMDFGS